MVRCSLAEFLDRFGDETLKRDGVTLEAEASNFNWREREPNARDQGKGSDLPPLNRGDDSDDGSGGGSFVVFQFKSNAKS